MALSDGARQQAEIELMAAMYPGEFISIDTSSFSITFEVEKASIFDRLRREQTTKWKNQQCVEVAVATFFLPETYPSTVLPSVTLDFRPSIDNAQRRDLRDALRRIIEDLPIGVECLDELTTKFQEAIERQKEWTTDALMEPSNTNTDGPTTQDPDDDNKHHRPSSSTTKPNPRQTPSLQKRKITLIWTHHILATSKRKFIHDTSKSLNLNGLCKPGHPGIIIVEGNVEDVNDFVDQVKGLRWQALSVKAEMALDEVDGRLRLGGGDGGGGGLEDGGDGVSNKTFVREVETVGEIAQALRGTTGLEEWFLEGMGIRK